MTAADIPAALGLWRVTEGMGLGESDRPERLEAYLDRNPGASAVAVLGDGTLVGAVLCGDDGRRGCLHHLAVARTQRRRGIARALVAHGIETLQARGIEKCNLFLFADNVEGGRFWQREGWVARADLTVMQVNVAGGATPGGAGCAC
jgi:putative acetyltransferase